MLSARRHMGAPGGQSGFTLVELLVAIAAGAVVVTAACGVMLGGLRVMTRVTGRVAAVQQSRTGMERLLQEMQSGCLADDVSPVLAATSGAVTLNGTTAVIKSDGTHVVFISGLGDSATPTPTEHVVSIQNGNLVDAAYQNTGGSPPALGVPSTWTFSATSSSQSVLAQNVTALPSTPLFQYLSYSNSLNPTANSLVNAKPLAVPLTSSTAPSVAEADIAWLAQPGDVSVDAGGGDTLQDAATFRLTPADPSSTNYPCD